MNNSITVESVTALRAHLGQYGDWVMRHGKKLPVKDPLSQKIYNAYARYLKLHSADSILNLIETINVFVEKKGWEPPPPYLTGPAWVEWAGLNLGIEYRKLFPKEELAPLELPPNFTPAVRP